MASYSMPPMSMGPAYPTYGGAQQLPMAMPMAAANIGGATVVGQDLNRDGIPDVLQQQYAAPPTATMAYAQQVPMASGQFYGSQQRSMAMPMAAANIGGATVVGQDLNRDGIPDVLQQQYAAPPTMAYAQQVPMASGQFYGAQQVSMASVQRPMASTGAAYRSYSPPRSVVPAVVAAPVAVAVGAPVVQSSKVIVSEPVTVAVQPTMQVSARSVAPMILPPVVAAPMPMMQSMPMVQPVFMAPPQQPRDVFVDRPFPVWNQIPVPVQMPTNVTHTWKNFAPRDEHDFPYHDPAYGTGWRAHYPDEVDEQWGQVAMYKETPFQDLLHRREEEYWRDLWEDAHMGLQQHNGWRHRPPPFSRRVTDPESLIPQQQDFYTELLL